jgi:phosphopantothenoylcysteine decarboxylase/phosphopantothenate--cysteine ligase
MDKACQSHFERSQVVVMAAAVADYKPKSTKIHKIKKKNLSEEIELVPTVDILKKFGENKTNQILVGFALETENEFSNALDKIKRKNLDAIVLNSLADEGAGFKHDTNKITFIAANGEQQHYPLKSKSEVANDVLHEIKKLIDA